MSYAAKKIKDFDYTNLWRMKCRLVAGKSLDDGIWFCIDNNV